ncbi:hypothetical protein SDJN03_26408, partial [Cucurbita argyrosperma subsp. sororia]
MEVALQAHVSGSWRRRRDFCEAQAGSSKFRLFHGIERRVLLLLHWYCGLSGIDNGLQEKEEESEPSETVSDVLDNSVETLEMEKKLTKESSLKLKLKMEANAKRTGNSEGLANENLHRKAFEYLFFRASF